MHESSQQDAALWSPGSPSHPTMTWPCLFNRHPKKTLFTMSGKSGLLSNVLLPKGPNSCICYFYCVTNDPKIEWFKARNFYYLMISMGQKPEQRLQADSDCSQCHLGLRLSQAPCKDTSCSSSLTRSQHISGACRPVSGQFPSGGLLTLSLFPHGRNGATGRVNQTARHRFSVTALGSGIPHVTG